MNTSFVHAANRFGLGARSGSPPEREPRAWLLAQIAPQPAAPGPSLVEIRQAMELRRQDRSSDALSLLERRENIAWAERMLGTEVPFAERWVAFWTNHLTVSRRSPARNWTGHYEREAIRPLAFGRFDALLLAAYRHPAMLNYLDQARSIGPGSPSGRRRRNGLNENLARECLELHTITPNAGYTQADVTALAAILTGWSMGRGGESGEEEGFLFRAGTHEPGARTMLGHEFPEGEAGGVQALTFLANHPATRAALARKLAVHFIADAPPPGAVARIEASLRESGGDLSAAARALVASPEAWTPLGKIRSGQDYAIAAMRGLGAGSDAAPQLVAAMARFNQPLWNAPAPTGWSDQGAEWAAPEQLMRRLDWAEAMAERAARRRRIEPATLAETMLGPLARAETVTAARRAGSVQEALLLLLASPEAQRR